MFALAAIAAAAATTPQFHADEAVPGAPFIRQVASGRSGGPIRYYIAPGSSASSPILLLLQGSGAFAQALEWAPGVQEAPPRGHRALAN